MRQQKASKGAVTSFIISTPETGVDSIAITWALLDPVMTIVRPVSAFFTASVTGLLVNSFDPERHPKQQLNTPEFDTVLPMAPLQTKQHGSCCSDPFCRSERGRTTEGSWQKVKRGMSYSFTTLLAEIGPWLLLGILLASLISVFLSPDFIEAYMGSGILSMLIMIALATPLYVCATASTPIAAALALKGLSPGAALVFLLAGPATNMATITVVIKLLGRKTATIYLASLMGCSLLLGIVVNWIYFTLGLSIGDWVQQQEHETHGIVYSISAIILLLLIIKPWAGKLFSHPPGKTG